jgi:SanA protein
MMKIIKQLIKILVLLGISGLVLSRILTAIHAVSRMYQVHSAPPKRVAIVFGAGLRWDGSPTQVLRDRVATAANLYSSGKVEKLLFSGDNRTIEYNEPQAMLEYAVHLGVPKSAIVLDYAGQSTYDTCYRARHIFGIKEAIIVTQKFHLPRALYTCTGLGLDTVGVPADRQTYRRAAVAFWNIRELPATLNAMLELHILRPLPVLGDPEPIYPLEAQ